MAWSRRNVLRTLSVIYLIALAALAAYALHTIRIHALPIPRTLGAFTLALPAIAGLTLESLNRSNTPSSRLTRHAPRLASRSSASQLAILALFVYETVLVTLAGTYLAPVDGLRCGLDERWLNLFRAKNGEVIKRIQDGLECCGLHSIVDKAWPFPDKNTGVDACVKRFERTKSCFEGWRAEERGVAGIAVGVVIGVAVWKILVIYVQSRGGPWYSEEESGAEHDEERSGGRRRLEHSDSGRRQLEYPNGESARYQDEPDVEDVGGTEDAVLASRVQPSQLRDDAEQWANERQS